MKIAWNLINRDKEIFALLLFDASNFM